MPLLEPTGLPQWYIEYCERLKEQFMEDAGEHPTVRSPGLVPFISSRGEDDNRQTNLLRDVAFNRHSMNDGQHVSPLDNGRLQVGTDGIEVRLVQGINEADFKRTLAMATRATIGVDLTDAPDDMTSWMPAGQDWEEMLKGGLQTALESAVIVFAVSGVSRTCTHQLVRSRRAAFHQQSQRASFYGVAPEVRMPESVWRNPRARKAALDAYAAAQEAYRVICEEDVSYQDARFVLPEGTTNYILCEYNVKEFRDVFAYRGCSMFSWEIVHVMREMRRLLVEAHPFLADSIKISCEKTSGAKDSQDTADEMRVPKEWLENSGDRYSHTCTFQGWERVEGQCGFLWARDSNRTFRSTTYEIGRKPERGMEIENNAPTPDWISGPMTAPGPSHPAAVALGEGEGPTVEEIIEIGRANLKKYHPSLADELDKEERGE